MLDRHSRGGQAGGEPVAFITQRIMFGGDDESGRQAREVGGVQRADPGVRPEGRVGDPQPGAPGDVIG